MELVAPVGVSPWKSLEFWIICIVANVGSYVNAR